MRCFRYKDLYDNVLFNYQWLYNKMCAMPLTEVLADFEDAIQSIRQDKHLNEVTTNKVVWGGGNCYKCLSGEKGGPM